MGVIKRSSAITGNQVRKQRARVIRKLPKKDLNIWNKIKKYEFKSEGSSRKLLRLWNKKLARRPPSSNAVRVKIRTVEVASSSREENNKLLFVVALGLCPNLDSKRLDPPRVVLHRLPTEVVAQRVTVTVPATPESGLRSEGADATVPASRNWKDAIL